MSDYFRNQCPLSPESAIDAALKKLDDIGNDRGNGNTITTTGIDVSTITRTTKTVTTDHPVTVQVLQDPEVARKNIENLANKITEAVNLVEGDKALKGDINFRKASSSLRRAFGDVVGVSGGAIQATGTSDALITNSEQLATKLGDELTFRRFEAAIQGRGGAAFKLINVTTGVTQGLEGDIASQVRQGKELQTQLADLNAEAEAHRADLLGGLKDIVTATISNAGAQAQTQAAQARGTQSAQNHTTNAAVRTAQQNQQSLTINLQNLSKAASSTQGARTTLQNLVGKLG